MAPFVVRCIHIIKTIICIYTYLLLHGVSIKFQNPTYEHVQCTYSIMVLHLAYRTTKNGLLWEGYILHTMHVTADFIVPKLLFPIILLTFFMAG